MRWNCTATGPLSPCAEISLEYGASKSPVKAYETAAVPPKSTQAGRKNAHRSAVSTRRCRQKAYRIGTAIGAHATFEWNASQLVNAAQASSRRRGYGSSCSAARSTQKSASAENSEAWRSGVSMVAQAKSSGQARKSSAATSPPTRP